MMTANLYKLSDDFIIYYAENNIDVNIDATIRAPDANSTVIRTWLEPKGEIVFFKKPSEILEVSIKPTKSVYTPGE